MCEYDDDDEPRARRLSKSELYELYELASLLDGTDDELQVGLSQLGFDPGAYSDGGLERLQTQLAKIGCRPDEKGRFWKWGHRD